MKIEKISAGMLGTNTYFIINEIDFRTIVIDPSEDKSQIGNFIKENKLNVNTVLLTHGHFDHIGSVKMLQDAGAKVYMHKKDVSKVETLDRTAEYLGIIYDVFTPDYVIEKEETLTINGYKIKVIETPGHTQGGVCYVLDNTIFSGDTIFKNSYGRVDFKGSNFDQIKESIFKIFALEGDYVILPGHGDSTLLSIEKANNPIRND